MEAIGPHTIVSSTPGSCLLGADGGGIGPAMATQLLKGEVLLPGSVTVAEINLPGGAATANVTVKKEMPRESVVTVLDPRNWCPSP